MTPKETMGQGNDALALMGIESRIALATDAGRWLEFQELFVAGAEVDYGDLGAGPVEHVLELIQESQAGYEGTMNCVTTHHSRISGDSATAETYVVSHHFRHDQDQSWDDQAGTHYHDVFTRTAEGWKVNRRVAELRWFRSDATQPGWLSARASGATG
jgi:hypothetical protein